MNRFLMAHLLLAVAIAGCGGQVDDSTVPPKPGTVFAFNSIGAPLYYGPAPSNVVIKDVTTWNKFLVDGRLKTEDGPLFSVDFSKQMVLGVFLKTSNACSATSVVRLTFNGQNVISEYSAQNKPLCEANTDLAGTLGGTPMNLVVMNRLDIPVKFIDVSALSIPVKTLVGSDYSAIRSAQNLMIKDSAAWNKLWAQHTNNSGVVVPTVDFTKRMVAAIFLGEKPSGCYAVLDANAWRNNGKLYITHHDKTPGTHELCTQSITTPAYFIELDRTDDPVEFIAVPTVY